MLEELAGSEADASWLVTAGFWIAVVDGWRFTEWEPDQPLREVVLADRAKRAEKMRGWRSRNQASSTPSNPATNSATNADSDATVPEPQPVPTRPDPDLSKKKEHVQKPAHDYSKEFDEFWSLYPRKQGKADAVKAYARARKTTEAKTLRDGAQAYSLMSIGANKNHIKLPGGWIREERWNDEPIAAIPSPLAKDERIIDVLEQGRRFQGDVRLAPEARMRQTLALGSSLTMLTPNSFCEIHPDYPFEIDGSCTACARSVGLAPRVAF
ncbi:hypothetical protein [Frigoribacterium sp. UYMn621]|uniref:hypothetical protein n=1 Tax=Frigoribacterium sp. UYMn621 TaxID=3156343 RepID=UPI00339340FB